MFSNLPYATKIVATIGPASDSAVMIEQLIHYGVNVFRFNFSHGSAEQHIVRAQLVRQASLKVGREVAIMADLQGPKIRVNKFVNGSITLQPGAEFILNAQRTELGSQQEVGVDYQGLPQDVSAGDVLLLNDGLIKLTVLEVENGKIYTKVEQGGTLSDHKGINKMGGGLSAPALTDKDRQDLQIAAQIEADYVAVSFPKDGADIELAHNLVAQAYQHKSYMPSIVAKIERAEALHNLNEIAHSADALMVARGDLAVEIGNALVPAAQQRIIKIGRQLQKPVIVATQMMESMITNPTPTRAEVSDVANAVLSGADAVMLSGESAVGRYPLQTVHEMKRICSACQDGMFEKEKQDYNNYQTNTVDQTIALATQLAAEKLQVKAIVALTTSGATALWLSKLLSDIPIYALTPYLVTQRKMTLYRNVRPILVNTNNDRNAAIVLAETELKKLKIINTDDLYVITSGYVMDNPGCTDTITIKKVS